MAASTDPLWRAAAAWALGVTGSDPDSPPIQALLSDAEFPVRGAALRAVVRLRKRSSDPPSQPHNPGLPPHHEVVFKQPVGGRAHPHTLIHLLRPRIVALHIQPQPA